LIAARNERTATSRIGANLTSQILKIPPVNPEKLLDPIAAARAVIATRAMLLIAKNP
jgi:hypothetical protein